MSAAGPTTSGGRGSRPVYLGIGLAVLVFAALIMAGSGADPVRLSPHSDAPQGTSALRAVLEEMGAEVEVDVPAPDLATGASSEYDTVLLLRDRMDDETRRREIVPWVRNGGVLVVADPSSALAPVGGIGGPEPGTGGLGDYGDLAGDLSSVERGECDLDPLADLDVEDLAVQGADRGFRPSPGDSTCFDDGSRAFVVATSRGEGTIVSLGSAGVLTNETLAGQESRDNAVVLAALLAPEPGTRVAVVDPTAVVVPSDESLWDLIPTWVKRVGVQLLVVMTAFVLWRGRRLGRPVAERRPVDVASSDLVAAVGRLMRHSGSPQHAADLLRADLRRDLIRQLGLSPDLPPEEFHSVVDARSRLDPGQLRQAMGPGPVTSDAELLDVAHAIDLVRKEVLASVGSRT